MNTYPTQMTKRQAYEAGLAGLPEPLAITKRVREFDPIKGEIDWSSGQPVKVLVEAEVETHRSVEIRAAWRKGRKTYECRQHVATLRNAEASQ